MNSPRKENQGFAGAVFGRLLHVYFLMTRGLTLGVRAVVRSDDGKFLLVRHTYTPGWHFPGGGVERGTSAEHALRSELHQETGLSIIERPRLHGIYFNNAVSTRDHVLVYLCKVEGSISDKPASLEIARIGFFGLDDLPDGTDPGAERRMREIVEGVEHRDEW